MAAESRLVSEIEARWGAAPGVVIFRNNVGVARFTDDRGRVSSVAYGVGGKGAPDLLVLVETVVGWLPLWVETKDPEGRVSPAQRDWHAAALRHGWFVSVVRSVDAFGVAVEGVRERARSLCG